MAKNTSKTSAPPSTPEIATATEDKPAEEVDYGPLNWLLKPGYMHPIAVVILNVACLALFGCFYMMSNLPNLHPVHTYVMGGLTLGLLISANWVIYVLGFASNKTKKE